MGNTQRDKAHQEQGGGPFRIIVPMIAIVLAIAGSTAFGTRILRQRGESRRPPVLAAIPIVAGLLAIVGAVAWRNRETLRATADDAVDTMESIAGDLSDDASRDGHPRASGTEDIPSFTG
jgi:hypothetical protein